MILLFIPSDELVLMQACLGSRDMFYTVLRMFQSFHQMKVTKNTIVIESSF